MYRNILMATDGSDLALRAARHGLALAKAVSARTTAVMVTPTWKSVALSEISAGRFEDEYTEGTKRYAARCLAMIEAAAKEAGVECEGVVASSGNPYEKILEIAAAHGCDLIVVGSHGRTGLSRLMLGSETLKVLTQSRIPVLVYRE